ncbi:MAG: hypothetical protein M1822_002570 [Bathelium mastoideum]|nr:MAG: hypothetical protein M1822_002570 [Bathelium mastoideum]
MSLITGIPMGTDPLSPESHNLAYTSSQDESDLMAVNPNISKDRNAWPPKPPDISRDSLDPENPPFAVSSNSELYKLKNRPLVYKFNGGQREYDIMKVAGDCAIKTHGRVLFQGAPLKPSETHKHVWLIGFIMDLATPLDPKTLNPSQHSITAAMSRDPSQRRALAEKMISVVERLHQRRVIHGDIKLANMVMCSDGEVRLCDFAEARFVGEDPTTYEGMETANYVSPRRCQNWRSSSNFDPPEMEDDIYGLGLSIWELYTGKIPFDGVYMDDIWDKAENGETVDVDEVNDEEIRPVIRELLRIGGAKV